MSQLFPAFPSEAGRSGQVARSARILIPEWQALQMRLSPADLRRHVLAIGETGSGKTESVLKPLINAMLCSTADPAGPPIPSALIIDPKNRELTEFLLSRIDEKRLVVIEPNRGNWLIPLFLPDPNGRILGPEEVLDTLVSANRENVEGNLRNAGFWIASARRMVAGFVAGDRWIVKNRNISSCLDLWQSLLGEGSSGFPSGSDRNRSGTDHLNVRELWYRGGYLDLLAHAISRSLANADFLRLWAATHKGYGTPAPLCEGNLGLIDIAKETFGGIVLTVQNLLDPFLLPATGGHLWTNPFLPPTQEKVVDPAALMDRGAVVIYCPPDPSTRSNVLGRAIKRHFFHSSLQIRDRSRPFLYIADEFQRFITADPHFSEATFFDRCRSYGISCIVATQSESSLRFAMETGMSPRAGESALQVILSNLATQFYFRTTDSSTQNRLRSLIPHHPTDASLPHVVDVRPVTSLAPGEAYWLAASGRWGRGRIQLRPPGAGVGKTP